VRKLILQGMTSSSSTLYSTTTTTFYVPAKFDWADYRRTEAPQLQTEKNDGLQDKQVPITFRDRRAQHPAQL